jgi:hypothetical protein
MTELKNLDKITPRSKPIRITGVWVSGILLYKRSSQATVSAIDSKITGKGTRACCIHTKQQRFTNSTSSWCTSQLFRCCASAGSTKKKWPSHSFRLAAKLDLNSVFSCYAMQCHHMFILVYVVLWVQLGFLGQFIFWYHEFMPILHTRLNCFNSSRGHLA